MFYALRYLPRLTLGGHENESDSLKESVDNETTTEEMLKSIVYGQKYIVIQA